MKIGIVWATSSMTRSMTYEVIFRSCSRMMTCQLVIGRRYPSNPLSTLSIRLRTRGNVLFLFK
jgi:hypothetical protein